MTEFETVAWTLSSHGAFSATHKAFSISLTHLRKVGGEKSLCGANVPRDATLEDGEGGAPCKSCAAKVLGMKGRTGSPDEISHEMVREATRKFLEAGGTIIRLEPSLSVPFSDFEMIGMD